MEYGLIGYPLKHSFSKEVHSLISDYSYELCELNENELNFFMKKKDFKGINVTIPYKQKVIPYLDFTSDNAKNINAVNTIINNNGQLLGYNTDILGVIATFSHFNIDVKNQNVLILGTGATSNTVYYAVKKCKAKNIYKAYRKDSKIKGDILYSDLNKISNEINIIINTTSNGMYPHADDNLLVNLEDFKNLNSVMDVVYNPLRTRLLIEAERLNIKAESGLYMLVAQAFFASELFLNKDLSLSNYNLIDKLLSDKNNTYLMKCSYLYQKCLSGKQNIVLSGMPTCGKTTLGKMISESYGYEFVDTDELIEKEVNCKIVDYINENGEESFRNIESKIIKNISSKNHLIISTGGGAILREENVFNLKSNGIIFFINRSLNLLKPSSSRPLTSDIESLTKKYNERIPIYKSTCDYEINGDNEFEIKIDEIFKKLKL